MCLTRCATTQLSCMFQIYYFIPFHNLYCHIMPTTKVPIFFYHNPLSTILAFLFLRDYREREERKDQWNIYIAALPRAQASTAPTRLLKEISSLWSLLLLLKLSHLPCQSSYSYLTPLLLLLIFIAVTSPFFNECFQTERNRGKEGKTSQDQCGRNQVCMNGKANDLSGDLFCQCALD